VARGRIVITEFQQLGADCEVGGRLARGDRPRASAVITTEIDRGGCRIARESRGDHGGFRFGHLGATCRSARRVRRGLSVCEPEQPAGRAREQCRRAQCARATPCQPCQPYRRSGRTRPMRSACFPSRSGGTPPMPVRIGESALLSQAGPRLRSGVRRRRGFERKSSLGISPGIRRPGRRIGRSSNSSHRRESDVAARSPGTTSASRRVRRRGRSAERVGLRRG